MLPDLCDPGLCGLGYDVCCPRPSPFAIPIFMLRELRGPPSPQPPPSPRRPSIESRPRDVHAPCDALRSVGPDGSDRAASGGWSEAVCWGIQSKRATPSRRLHRG